MLDEQTSLAVWLGLLAGQDLARLRLKRVDERFDLRGLATPDVSKLASLGIPLAGGHLRVEGQVWRDLEFCDTVLAGLRFDKCTIENCRLTKVNCIDWRLWRTQIKNCDFEQCDLSQSALGGIFNGAINHYEDVKFRRCDLRSTAYVAAEFARCTFQDCDLDRIDFNGSIFIESRFEGVLKEVVFHQQAFGIGTSGLPPNLMRLVDFTGARFQNVEFRDLAMESALWPGDKDHILVDDYRAALEKLIKAWDRSTDLRLSQAVPGLKVRLKFLPPSGRGVISKLDLRAVGGEFAVSEAERLLNEF